MKIWYLAIFFVKFQPLEENSWKGNENNEGATTLSITTLSIMAQQKFQTALTTLSKNETQH